MERTPKPTDPYLAARRFEPGELPSLDLHAADPRLVWAIDARASSEWSSSYAATSACGPPAIYPKGGDEYGTWLAESGDGDPWIELSFPEATAARAIVVCETCGPGAVREIRDVARDAVLYAEKPVRIAESREARLLHVPLPPGTPVPTRLRIRVAPYGFGSDYHEIDAVALLTEPLDAILASPRATAAPAHRRYAPGEVRALDLRGDWRIRWASRARASSEWSSSYAARAATGPPNVFPRGGDIERTWLSASDDRNAWLELEFPECERVYGLVVLETCGAGSVVRATDEHGATLFSAKREVVPSREARLLHVPLPPGPPPARLRLWVSAAESDYREIDAVALLLAPFEELFEPPPPPPPPPVPGAPQGGFTTLEGVLVGASRDAPFVHATLRTRGGGRAENHGGPLTLRLESGDEVRLELGRTALYGGTSARRAGPWARVRAEVPWLAAAFADAPPEDGELVSLEGSRLDGEVRVEVAGEPSALREAGFRDSARRRPEALVAVAISRGPLASTPFAEEGSRAFERGATAFRPGEVRRHPLARWAWIATGSAAALLAALGADVAAGGGSAGVLGALALLGALFFLVLALDLSARIAFVPTFLRRAGQSLRDRKPAFGPPGWMFFLSALGLVLLGIVAGPIVGASNDPAVLAFAVPLVLTAPFALLRLGLLLWRHGAALGHALYVAFAPRGRLAEGASGRFTGTLASGQRLTRTEVLLECSEHLGTETYTDEQGRTSTRDRYRTWLERHVAASAPEAVLLTLADGTPVSCGAGVRTTHLGLRVRPPESTTKHGGSPYARFESVHVEGDEATLLGVVASRGEDGALELRGTHLVLGSLGELRRRAFSQASAMLALAALASAPVVLLLLAM